MNWPEVALGDAAEIVSGATPSSAEPELWNGGVLWATPTDLSRLNSKYIESTERTISERGLASCSARVLPPSSVLFSSRAPIGLVAINTAPMATNQGFKSFVPKRHLDASYLYWWLRSNRERMNDLGNGATFKEVSKAVVSRVLVPLPPLKDQRRIAAILDKAEAVRRKREQAVALADDLLKSAFLEMFAAREWPTKNLSKVVTEGTIVTYGIVQAGPEYPGGVPYIRTGDIKEGRILVEGLRHTSPEIASKFARSTVRSGEIVMSIRATVGTTAVVPDELDGANLTQGTARISPGSEVTPEYLLYFLRSSACQNWLEKQVKGATFREITLARLRELEVPLPPPRLQRTFSELSRKARESQRRLTLDCRAANELFSVLSQRAFRGEL